MAFPHERKQTGEKQGTWSVEIWKECDSCNGTGHEVQKHETYHIEAANTAMSVCRCCSGSGKTKQRSVTLTTLDLTEADSFLSKFSVTELSAI